MLLSEKEQQEINTLVGRFEADTGIQAVAAVAGKADAYPEIPWKAYALGSAAAALASVFYPTPFADWSIAATLAFHAVAVLGAGAALACAATFVPSIGRLFVGRARARVEARQYAQAMFVEREVFCTANRRALLVLVSRFERAIVILPDRGLAQYAPPDAIDRICETSRAALASGGLVAAFDAAFSGVRAFVATRGFTPELSTANALDDAVLAERGP